MDRESVVAQPDAAPETIRIEQAVFTSIRSPMGEGYRIVAASRGVSPEEKKEIVQCAPSHGSLCDPSPDATGVASFGLRSGRHCLFLVQNAGVEHTARGGFRICTRVLLMEPEHFDLLHCDALAVRETLLAILGTDPPCNPAERLDPVQLSATPKQRMRLGFDLPPAPADLDRLATILAATLAGRRMLVVGAATPQAVLGQLLTATPAAIRRRLSLSTGIKFAPTRGFQLVFADAEQKETTRITRDHEIDLFHWDSTPPATNSPFNTWLRFARQRWQCGQSRALDRLSAQLTQDDSAEALEQVVTLATDIEQLKHVDAEGLEQLVGRHAQAQPQTDARKRLLSGFRAVAQARREELANLEKEAESEPQSARSPDAQGEGVPDPPAT